MVGEGATLLGIFRSFESAQSFCKDYMIRSEYSNEVWEEDVLDKNDPSYLARWTIEDETLEITKNQLR